MTAPGGDVLLAHGRDPYFPGWTDTLQLDYANPATHEAMAGELLAVAGRCDGVRCDMAMLVLPDVFERTWGRRPATSFWPDAIGRVRERVPDFTLHGRGLLGPRVDDACSRASTTPTTSASTTACATARPARSASTCRAGLDYQSKLARFLENHDEPRAAATFPPGRARGGRRSSRT